MGLSSGGETTGQVQWSWHLTQEISPLHLNFQTRMLEQLSVSWSEWARKRKVVEAGVDTLSLWRPRRNCVEPQVQPSPSFMKSNSPAAPSPPMYQHNSQTLPRHLPKHRIYSQPWTLPQIQFMILILENWKTSKKGSREAVRVGRVEVGKI